ncbi:hypothetical protein AVEN_98169-1 [Araneus ventricosus]|uniref:Uncharacterized protein n=1 Tax=Araneus ventricosus TaxID=182803 RepID=A0A4Y2QEC8_ARAVE|nr:hypothetical protein AVEN_98169-1 [Araneus ventricosus]
MPYQAFFYRSLPDPKVIYFHWQGIETKINLVAPRRQNPQKLANQTSNPLCTPRRLADSQLEVEDSQKKEKETEQSFKSAARTDRTPPHAPVPDAITATVPVGWEWETRTDTTPPHALMPVTITVTKPVGWTWDCHPARNYLKTMFFYS